MFKKGDIVVYLGDNSSSMGNNGTIWKTPNISMNKDGCYNKKNKVWFSNIRLATKEEIKWFNLGITNVNQIPEVGGTFNNNIVITEINNRIVTKYNGYYTFKYWVENYKDSYKPPIKSNSERDVMFGKEFTITDLNDCKIDNLTPEDNKIIQPFLFKLGYIWGGSDSTTLYDSFKSIIVKKNKKLYSFADYNKEIKKEVILNYINNQKQLNTNTNEILRQTEEVTRGQINGTARVVSGRQQITTGSRPKGNIQRVKIRKTQVRKFEISGKVRLR